MQNAIVGLLMFHYCAKPSSEISLTFHSASGKNAKTDSIRLSNQQMWKPNSTYIKSSQAKKSSFQINILSKSIMKFFLLILIVINLQYALGCLPFTLPETESKGRAIPELDLTTDGDHLGYLPSRGRTIEQS